MRSDDFGGVRLFVSGFDYDMTDRELAALFRYYVGHGAVLDAWLVPSPDVACQNKGVGFITVREQFVEKALALDGAIYDGRRLDVKLPGPRPARKAA